MKDNIPPEEKLLRLIRGEKKKKPLEPSLQEAGPNKEKNTQVNDFKSPAKRTLQSLISLYFTHAFIKKAIPVLMLISVIYLIASLVYPWLGLKKINLPQVSEVNFKEPIDLPKEEPKPFEYYSEEARERHIFGTSSMQGSRNPTQAGEAGSIKDINLVGIISGENPQAVIEDKKTQKTYYVSKGQFIGDFQVEDIQEGKIILNNKGQRYELFI